MVCHSCQKEEARPWIRVNQQGIPPGEEGHNITYNHIELLLCQSCGCSEIEIHDHDCFDYEDIHNRYEWYLLDSSDTAKLVKIAEACPSLLSPDCNCPVHNALRTSCRSLPSSPWLGGRGVEADFHIHRAYLEVKDGLPKILGKG